MNGPGPQTNALPGVIGILCGANPVACLVVGVAALAILAGLYLACTNSNNQITNACIAAGMCPSGGSCGLSVSGPPFHISLGGEQPSCNSCSGPPVAHHQTNQICADVAVPGEPHLPENPPPDTTGGDPILQE